MHFFHWRHLQSVCVCLLLVCTRAATGAVLEIRLKFCNCISFAYFSFHLPLVCIALHCVCAVISFFRCAHFNSVQHKTHAHTHTSPFFRSIVVRIPYSHFPYVLAFFNLHYNSFGKVKFDVRKARDKHFSADLLAHSHSLTHSHTFTIHFVLQAASLAPFTRARFYYIRKF